MFVELTGRILEVVISFAAVGLVVVTGGIVSKNMFLLPLQRGISTVLRIRLPVSLAVH